MPTIFDPIKLGKLDLRNRSVLTAMHLCYSRDGMINDRIIDFYVERAAGGVGLITIGGCHPEERGKVWVAEIGIDHDNTIPGLTKLAEAVHKEGAAISAQLLHGGRVSHPALTKAEPISSWNIPFSVHNIIPHVLTADEIKEVIGKYVEATRRILDAGFDAVELHGGMGYLINQFMAPGLNHRPDEYGGAELSNRLRFPKEIIAGIKERAGDDFPVIFKFSGTDLHEHGIKLEEGIRIAREMERAGADAVHISPGWHDSGVPIMVYQVPQSAYVFTAQEIKRAVKIPVIASTRMRTVEKADEVIRNHQADMVALARPFITDPYLIRKAQEKKYEDIRQCLNCSQGCFDQMLEMKEVTCILNPTAGRERELQLTPVTRRKRVMIIGAGPAGMEAARVAATRGHDVTLFEKSDHVGGQLDYAIIAPAKEALTSITEYYDRQFAKLGVDVRLNTEVNEHTVNSIQPDAVVLAIGSRAVIPKIPGIDKPHVKKAEDVLLNRVSVGQEVVIIGGATVGCETAETIAKQGAMSPDVAMFLLRNGTITLEEALRYTASGTRKVTMLEIRAKVGVGFGKSVKWVFLQELEKCGVTWITNISVKEITDNGVVITSKKEGERLIPADTVIIAAGYRSSRELVERIANNNGREVYQIGDCVEPRNIMYAVREGYEVGLKI
ncbi:MAG TPA: FAD-dependent oxidoreductase [Blastocatellia bacterium]|nr:FAD-dependent oxidoreductase [Blastocatellia bacterium]